MHPHRYQEIRRFYQTMVPRLRNDNAPLSGVERAAVIRAMGELINATKIDTRA